MFATLMMNVMNNDERDHGIGPNSQVSALFISSYPYLLVFLHMEMRRGGMDSNRTSCVPTGVYRTDV